MVENSSNTFNNTLIDNGGFGNWTTTDCVIEYLESEYGEDRRHYITVAYALLFVLGSIANVSVGISLLRLHNTRVRLLMFNLCAADTMVVFVVMPLEMLKR